MSTEMEHTNEQNYYTERYLLGELSDEDRRAYEDHFFNCQICGEDVAAAARMMAAGRRLAEDERKVIRPHPARWRGWVPPAVAASVISASLGWLGAVQYLAPRAATVPTLVLMSQSDVKTSEERGPGESTPQYVNASKGRIVSFEIPPRDDAESYVVSVLDSAGRTVLLPEPVSRVEAENYLHLVVPRELPRGNYRIVIEGVRKGGIRFSVTDIPILVGEKRGP